MNRRAKEKPRLGAMGLFGSGNKPALTTGEFVQPIETVGSFIKPVFSLKNGKSKDAFIVPFRPLLGVVHYLSKVAGYMRFIMWMFFKLLPKFGEFGLKLSHFPAHLKPPVKVGYRFFNGARGAIGGKPAFNVGDLGQGGVIEFIVFSGFHYLFLIQPAGGLVIAKCWLVAIAVLKSFQPGSCSASIRNLQNFPGVFLVRKNNAFFEAVHLGLSQAIGLILAGVGGNAFFAVSDSSFLNFHCYHFVSPMIKSLQLYTLYHRVDTIVNTF